jgi:hypothetical protein
VATPTEAQAKQQLSDTVKIWEEFRKYVGVTATPYLTREQTVIQELKSQFYDAFSVALGVARGDLNTFVLRLASVVEPLMRDYAQVINVPETVGALIFRRLYQYYIDSTFRVQSRMINFGAAGAVSSVGDGVINRLTVDENGFACESCNTDTKIFRCLYDEHSGANKHEEQFEVRGQAAERDLLKITGSNVYTSLRGLSARDSQQLLSNPSFDNYGGTSIASPDPITDWTYASAANFEVDTTNYYRDFEGAVTPAALKIKGNDTIQQDVTTRRANFTPSIPYYAQVAWNREVGLGDGTLTFRVGAQTVSVVLAAQVGWQILRIPLGTGNWFKNFDQSTFLVSVQLAGRTTGYVLVDDIILAPMSFLDGTFIAMVGGRTKWLRYDKYQYVDALYGSDAVIQQWIGWRTYGMYLPSAVAAPTVACTAALAGAGAGNVTNGTHSWYITCTGPTGVGESAVGPKSNVLNVANNAVDGKVNLTGIPLGPAGTVSRKVYRTITADAGSPKLVGTIADNVTTTFQDNVADGSLGAVAPAGVTWTDP